MLTRDQIKYLLDELSYETVLGPGDGMDVLRIQKKALGYSDDKMRGSIQAALSIMLEATVVKDEVVSDVS